MGRVAASAPSWFTAELVVKDLATGTSRSVYQMGGHQPPFIAEGLPFCACWSPDSQRLAFVGRGGGSGLTLFVWDGSSPNELKRVCQGGPLFFVWAGNGRSILVHSGEDLFIADPEKEGEGKGLPQKSISSRCPALLKSSGKLAYAAHVYGRGNRIFVLGEDGAAPVDVAQVGRDVVIQAAPDREAIAYVERDDVSTLYYRGINLLDIETGHADAILQEPLLAFFWSPDGEKIAYLSQGKARDSLALKTLFTKSGKILHLGDLVPSSDMAVVLAFFDQFGQSNRLWSPDSRKLAYVNHASEGGQGGNGHRAGDGICVVDVEDPGSAKQVAAGTLAFWRWA